MISFLLATLQATTVAAPVPVTPVPAAPLARFADLPNVAVTYYDVTGADARAVIKSIETQAPQRDPVSQRPIPATSDWSVNASVKNSTTGGKCKITGATVNFTATARLPRLVPGAEPIAPTLQTKWNHYVAQLEARHARQLRFAFDRLPAIKSQILASSCDNWKAVAAAAVEKLKLEKAAAQAADPTPPPQLTD